MHNVNLAYMVRWKKIQKALFVSCERQAEVGKPHFDAEPLSEFQKVSPFSTDVSRVAIGVLSVVKQGGRPVVQVLAPP
jgi:hypothetical protein